MPKVTALPRKRSRIMNPRSLAPEFMLLITCTIHPSTHTHSKEELPNNLQSNTLPGIYSISTNTHVHRSVSKNVMAAVFVIKKVIVNPVEDKLTYKKKAI